MVPTLTLFDSGALSSDLECKKRDTFPLVKLPFRGHRLLSAKSVSTPSRNMIKTHLVLDCLFCSPVINTTTVQMTNVNIWSVISFQRVLKTIEFQCLDELPFRAVSKFDADTYLWLTKNWGLSFQLSYQGSLNEWQDGERSKYIDWYATLIRFLIRLWSDLKTEEDLKRTICLSLHGNGQCCKEWRETKDWTQI